MTVTAVAFLASPLATTADHRSQVAQIPGHASNGTYVCRAPDVGRGTKAVVQVVQTSWSIEAFLLAAALATAASWACSTPPCARHQSWPDSGRV